MRYLYWDVLLFPGSSRVPLQEFGTKCHVLPDWNNRFIDNAALNSNPYLTDIEFMSQIPVLTSFVPSLDHGIPFRVSVHSWETPKASQVLRTFKAPEETVAYEARIYIDGQMVAYRLFDNLSVWPEVIDSTGSIDATHPKPLRFPEFHTEILDQAHWEPGEMFGRIRIIIAEGVTRHGGNSKSSTVFDRLRDVVAFSFQHAPKHILEYSGIAWPNPRLFWDGRKKSQRKSAVRVSTVPDFEAHAHSPQRQKFHDQSASFYEPGPSTLFVSCGRSTDNSNCEDPFVGPVPISLRGKQSQFRNSSNDVLMNDYNSVRTARSHAGTDMSGISYQKPNFERAMNEAAISEIVQALSPDRKQDLLHALSPEQGSATDRLEMSTKDQKLATSVDSSGQGPLNDTPVPAQSTSDLRSHSNVLHNNLATSRYSSVPILTPSTMLPRVRRSFFGLRTSVDPLLASEWDSGNTSNDINLGRPTSSLQLRTRSSSNASKRKRLDSPSPFASVEAFGVPSMSTSPCKKSGASPDAFQEESTAGNGKEGVFSNGK